MDLSVELKFLRAFLRALSPFLEDTHLFASKSYLSDLSDLYNVIEAYVNNAYAFVIIFPITVAA